jgi:lysozyme
MKKVRPPLLLLITLAIGLILWLQPTLRYRLIAWFEYPFHYREYKHFGIRIPSGYTVHGIDVSRYQSKIDWARVKRMQVGEVRISFAFIKATEGSWLTDPRFATNWEQCKRQQLVRGAYHFFLPNISPAAQAKHFIKKVRLQSGDLPPVVDVEEARGMTREQVQRHTLAFIELLEKHYNTKPIIYTNRDFYKNHFGDDPNFKRFIFWIAHYDVADLTMPDASRWHFWQHSDRGNVSGINEPVDFNVFYGDSATLRRLCLP